MIQDVENFFKRMMEKSNIDMARAHSDATYEHKFLIKQKNLVNMIVDRVIQARHDAGLPPASKTTIANIVKTSVWNKVYTIPNVKRAFRRYYGSTGKSGGIFVSKGVGGMVQVVFMRGKYAEKVATSRGNLIPKTNMAMQDLWFEAISVIKTEMGKRRNLGLDLAGSQVPERFRSPPHAGARLHGDTSAKGGFQTTIAKQVLAEGGGEGAGFDDAVKNFDRNFREEYPEDGWLMDQAVTQIFNPIKKKYKVKDIQDFTSASGTREISVTVEYGDARLNREMNWADADGIKRAAKDETDKFIKFLGASKDEVAEEGGALQGSDSFNTKATKIVQGKLIESLLKVKGTRPDFRLKVNKKLLAQAKKAKGKKRGQGGFDINEAIKTAVVASTKAKTQKVRKGRPNSNKKGVSRTIESPIALRNILNEALPQMVASKMTPPALQYRTGRFANSTRIENVNIGSRGGLHIDYTYMRNPYETFEPGGKQGSTLRDPRKIIGASIRELAMGILGRQPTTLRRQ
tara:strand:+ start:11947 stop:13494 length:1548 start_codon:yes stop_codon:yes gene_type:complete